MKANGIFISHSSKTTLAFTQEVVAALEAKGLDPLWDKEEIQGGDEWRQRIADLLAECRAAVILFSPEALLSPWVLYEASILSWRRRREPAFKLVPVLVGGVEPKQIQERDFAPLVLAELQALGGNPDTPAKIAALLPSPTNLGSKKTPLERVTDLISDELGKSVPGKRVRQVAEDEGISVAWDPQRDELEAFHEEIARHMFRDGVEGLPKWLKAFHTIEPDTARKLLKVLAPFWVPIESACQLVEHVPAKASAGLNGRPDRAKWTGEMFVRRAWWPSQDERFIDPGTGFDQNVADQVIERVREQLLATRKFLSRAEVDEYLADPDPPLYVLLRKVDPATLQELQAGHGNVRFLVHAGESLGPLEQAAYRNLSLLRPELDLDVEDRARKAHLKVSLILEGEGT